MKLGIMQPYFFPYIGYFQAINLVDEYILYDNLYFSKGANIYRNKYLTHAGNVLYFNVPLKDKSAFKKINEVEVLDDSKWRKKMLLDFYMNYKKAPYFNDVYPILESVINFPTNQLSELNYQSIKQVCDYLKIKTLVSNDLSKFDELELKLSTETIDKNLFPDYELENLETKVIRILEICKLKKANVYINAIGGMNLYSKEVFQANGIELKFVKTNPLSYQQYTKEFVPNMSIIDVLMFNTVDEVNHLLNQCELI